MAGVARRGLRRRGATLAGDWKKVRVGEEAVSALDLVRQREQAAWLGAVLDYMGKNKQHGTPQGKTMDHYALPASQRNTRHTSGRVGQCDETKEPSRAELLQANHGSRQALENKI
ncbi:hypothetical protein NDU88_002349 [Pleurodeles waltl]|uniref:Uncharacterized protein n=1 Tax=Pleurodeles waltl TaxID=8319 RepID=A0AAV7QCM6_PLEWA|nr:hypothetical protein NDU88_002349 [Pleurodeles waltl]